MSVEVPLGRRARRALLVERQDGLCFYCDAPMTTLRGPRLATIDHIAPLSDGGMAEPANEVAACHQCNRMKGCMTPDQMRRMADRIDAAIRGMEVE